MSEFVEKLLRESFSSSFLKEAGLENDYGAYQKANEFVKKAKELISQFPSKFVSYNPKDDFSQVKIGEMTFQLFGKNNKLSQQYAGQMNAAYSPRTNVFSFFNADITYDKNSKKLSINFSEKEAVHELTHFLDLKRSGGEQTKTYLKKLAPQYTDDYLAFVKKAGREPGDQDAQALWQNHTGQSATKGRDRDEYSNDPYELNAHFMEHIMPEVNNYISKTMEVPPTFEEFKNKIFQTVLNNNDFNTFYKHLNDQNKRKIIKRIAVYYQQLKDFVAKDQHVDFSKENTSLEIEKPVLDKFFQKIKGIMGGGNKKAA
jgi:hypothetical protein